MYRALQNSVNTSTHAKAVVAKEAAEERAAHQEGQAVLVAQEIAIAQDQKALEATQVQAAQADPLEAVVHRYRCRCPELYLFLGGDLHVRPQIMGLIIVLRVH